MEDINCNLCGSPNHVKFIELSDYRTGRLDHPTSLVKCSQCGLVYQNPRPTLAEMEEHYSPNYEPYIPQEDIRPNSYLDDRFIRYGIDRRCRIITVYKNKGRLLEIGCGAGDFLKAMAKTPGWETHGIEINPVAAQVARQRYGLDITIGTLDQVHFQSSFFDAVALWDVLEHLHDPIGTLHEIYRITKPDGLLVIRVPNLDSLDARLFGKYWSGFDAPRHLYVFNRETISRILHQTGFTIYKMESKLGSYASFVLSIRFLLSGKNPSPFLAKKFSNLISHSIIRLAISPYFMAISTLKRGPELTVVAFKQR